MINKDRLINEFIELVEIDSVGFKEREMADVLTKKLTEMGFEVFEDDAGIKDGGNCGNLICTLKGEENVPQIMLSAHMDTVEPGIGKKAVIRDGYIYSLGNTVLGSDDVAGITSILEAVRSIKEEGFSHGTIQIVFTVCEEQGLLGATNIDKSKLNADLGFIMDLNGEIGTFALRAASECNIKASIKGRASHAGIEPEKGISAIKIAGEAIYNMNIGRIDHETTANIGYIHGGGATNIICDCVELDGEARSLDEIKLKKQIFHMRECIENATQKFGGEVEIKETIHYKSVNVKEDSTLYKVLKEASDISNIPLNPICTGGGSDANIFANMGIPCVAVSNGMEDVHTKNERISIENLCKTATFVTCLIKATRSL